MNDCSAQRVCVGFFIFAAILIAVAVAAVVMGHAN